MLSFEQLEFFERWLPVVGYEGLYEVSDWGRVRSLGRATTAGRILVRTYRRDLYPSVALCRNGRPKQKSVHQLVAGAFIGPRPIGKDIDHIDGDRNNACVTNLRYVTRAENQKGMRERLGRWPSGKLAKRDAMEIRRLDLEGMGTMKIAALFKVCRSTVRRIVKNETWKIERKG
jgi:hypothetical protein